MTRPGPEPDFWMGVTFGIALSAAVWFVLWMVLVRS